MKKIFSATLLFLYAVTCLVAATEHTIPSKNASGVYQIGTAGELWGFADIVNGKEGQTQNLTANAVLTADIDMGGEAGGNWPGLGEGSGMCYGGTFDGKGHTISNFYMKDHATRFGLFNSIQKATVKNFKVNGKIVITAKSPTMVGVIGDVDPNGTENTSNASTVQNIHSSVNINCYDASASRIGGIAGCISNKASKIEGCRYDGTITAGPAKDGIGGIVGDVRGGIINNSLFDGTITTTATSDVMVGGIAGKVTNNPLSMTSVFSNGSITLVSATNAGSGALVGTAGKTVTLKNAFYNLNAVTGTSTGIGTNTASTSGTAEDVTNLAAIYDGTLHFRLGEVNWKQESYTEGNYPYPGTGGKHTHRYDGNGYCIADGEVQAATKNSEGYYEIANAGNLIWFLQQVNAGKTTYNAKLTADIYLNNVEFSGIGTSTNKYAGTFDGQGHTIFDFKRTVTSGTNNGLFNYTNGATIKCFTLVGAMTFSQTSSSAFNAAVVGLATNSTIEDVTSSVNITCTTAMPRLVAGIAGRIESNSTINRCRYNGAINAGPTGDQVAGIVANVQSGAVITNSLFDGKITCSSTAAADKMHIGGIVACSANTGNLTLSNNLVVGTITLAQNAVTTNCGLLYGNLSNVGTVKSAANHYTTTGSSITNAGGAIKAGQSVTATEKGSSTWYYIKEQLGSLNWVFAEGISYPIPGNGTVHIHNYANNGFCTCSTEPYEEPAIQNGVYQIANGGQLFWFATEINRNVLDRSTNAVLTNDINLENRDFPGIGNDIYKYAGVFNGQHHTISGYKHTTTASNQGLFNNVEKATIGYFNLVGAMTVKHSNAGSVVGSASAVTKISDVNSSVTMTISNGTASNIGGIVGSIGSTANSTPALVVRCRFNGTINAGEAYNTIGGLVGAANSLKIGFCLFDGTINAQSTNAAKKIAGIVAGSASTTNTIALYSILSHGTISLGTNTSKCGIVYGDVQNCGLLHVDNSYYTTTKTGSLTSVGPAKRSTDFVVTHTASEQMMTTRVLGTQLGFDNWYWCNGQAYPLPGELHTCNHENQDTYGLCANCSHLSPVQKDAEGAYLVKTASDFGRIRSLLNSDQLHGAISVKMTADINMSGSPVSYIEPMGTEHNPFIGTFDGQGHSFIGVTIDAPDHDGTGFFGYVKDATIKNLKFKKGNGKGTMLIDCSKMNAPVVGYAMGKTTLEDIDCDFDITVTSAASQIGGIVGRTESNQVTLNRCRYSGTIYFNSATDAVGGIVGQSDGVEMKNCLFDGTLSTTATIPAGGLVGKLATDNTVISYSLSHGSYTVPSATKAGAILGYADSKALTLAHVIYIKGGKVTGAYGSSYNGTVSADLGYPLDLTSDPTRLKSGARAILGDANWQAGTNYPIPGTNGGAHTHNINANGFCDGNDGVYQEAQRDADGYYMITNAGQLWWMATQINSGKLPINARIKLMNDIDMEGKHPGSFPGFCPLGTKTENGKPADDWNTAYSGIFDGQGHTINNFYASYNAGIRKGLFNAINNATVKNFNINGTIDIVGNGNNSGAQIGAAVGVAIGNSHIDDINSSVNIIGTGVRGLGGIVGCMENSTQQPLTSLNRCRYNGTITLTGTGNTAVGGICGELRSAIIRNSLFDGTINVGADVAYKHLGGIVGKVSTNNNSEMHRVLCHGTITLGSYTAATNESGIVIGFAERSLYMTKVFHTTQRGVSGLPALGPHMKSETINNENNGVVGETVTYSLILGESSEKSDGLNTADFRQTLGTSNWASENSEYVYPKKDMNHIHHYENGFCNSGDGEYERPNAMGDVYQIDNGGKLYWFAEHFNAGEIAQNATVEILKNIDMDGEHYDYPGIGTADYKFTGSFLGYSHIISNFYRVIVNKEGTGLINYAVDAQIKDFTLTGSLKFNLAGTKSFHGTVVGMATGANTVISDVTSSVNVDMGNQYVRVFGGIAGRSSGIMKNCRYSGTIQGKGSGEQMAGILANAKEKIDISDCLFDGSIITDCTIPKMRVSGILSSNEKGTGALIKIVNCVFNGCLDLKHSYVEPAGTSHVKDDKGNYPAAVKETENGIIAGYLDSNQPSTLNNLYYLEKCFEKMNNLPIGSSAVTPKDEKKEDQTWAESADKVTDWAETVNQLNQGKSEDDTKWAVDTNTGSDGSTSSDSPTLTNQSCKHNTDDSYFNEFGWCKKCGTRRELTQDTDGKFKLTCIADLASFRDLVNSGTITEGTVLNAKLTGDVDFSRFEGDLGEPIGNTHYNRYLYNFDGQGYTIKNIRVTTDNQFVGFFGYAGDENHDCYIHDFTITGVIDVPYDSKQHDNSPLYMGVVGKMYRGTIENVHSQLVMKNSNPTRAMIGGILGCAETGDAHSVTISKCSFTGTCYANAVGNMGGIIGCTSKNTLVENCTFAGTMDHSYTGENNTTRFGGIVGYNEAASFRGVKNCVVAGVLKTDPDRKFVNYGEAGNHKNILCGEDYIINNSLTETYRNQYSGNYALQEYEALVPTNSVVFPTFVSQQQIVNGEVCALLNAKDAKPNDVQNGTPWGQIIGYQLSGNKTADSPAQRVPLPGYQNPKKTVYKVVKDASNNYIIDYLYLDDEGDSTPLPSGATSIKAKKVSYHRAATYMTQGFVSVCVPFALNADNLPGGEDCKVVVFDQVKTIKDEAGKDVNAVYFKDATAVDGAYAAGVPYFLYLPESNRKTEWSVSLENANGITLAAEPINPATGIIGSFNTIKTGEWSNDAPMYKIKNDGVTLVETTATSSCYPYRAYLKLPAIPAGSNAPYRISFDNLEDESDTAVETLEETQNTAVPCFNLQGQPVNASTKGIIIAGGKKYIIR